MHNGKPDLGFFWTTEHTKSTKERKNLIFSLVLFVCSVVPIAFKPPSTREHNKAEASQKGQVVFPRIDLSKKSFQLHGVDARGHVLLKKKLNRKALVPFIANLPKCVIGIEACGGSHF